MLKKILIGGLVVIAAFLIFVALRPADFRVERSATIAAPAQTLFEQVNDHHNFNKWNPFLKMDPNVKNTFSGPDSGVGAACSWDGNKDIGAGSATITESKPGELVRMRMDWIRPMAGVATVDFIFKPEGDKTVVTWAMYERTASWENFSVSSWTATRCAARNSSKASPTSEKLSPPRLRQNRRRIYPHPGTLKRD